MHEKIILNSMLENFQRYLKWDEKSEMRLKNIYTISEHLCVMQMCGKLIRK